MLIRPVAAAGGLLKIALVADYAGPLSRAGEADPVALPLAGALARRRHRVTLWVRDAEAPVPAGVRLARLPDAAQDGHLAGGVPAAADALAAGWAADPPNLVHALSWTAGLAALSGGRDLDIPLVQTFAELAAPDQPQFAARSRLEAATARGAALLVAWSTAAEEELRRRVPRVPVAMIPCGVDVDAFRPDGPAAGL